MSYISHFISFSPFLSLLQEYVERSVSTFGSEATTVGGVCGRFRDLLNLRLQLLLKVHLALSQLHQARRQLLLFVQVRTRT